MGKQNEQTVERGGFLPMVITVGGFFLFLGVVVFYWFDRSPPTVARGGNTPEERVQLLRETRVREDAELKQYGWVDREAGIVRLPIDRAMDLVLEEINQGQSQN
jgi:hypothetical protein